MHLVVTYMLQRRLEHTSESLVYVSIKLKNRILCTA
jgi:hypothetical protein